MQFLDRISAIERRAAALNLSLWRVAALADVDYSNIHRWRRQKNSPRLVLFETVMAKIEDKVTEIERATLADLGARTGPGSDRRPAA